MNQIKHPHLTRPRTYLGLAIALVLSLASTACEDATTSVRLQITVAPSLTLDGVAVTVDGHRYEEAMVESLQLLVPDRWAGAAQRIEVEGTLQGVAVAAGAVIVTPIAGREVTARVTLVDAGCDLVCNVGDVDCEGDAVATCEIAATGCPAWGSPTACPAAMPFCSNGACAESCSDDCTSGATKCEGSTGERTCGQFDTDSCLEWGPAVACANGCSNGACTAGPTCTPEIVTVDSSGNPGFDTALGLDGAGGVHLAYFAFATGNVQYAYRPAGGPFTVSTLHGQASTPNQQSLGAMLSLAVTPGGAAHASYWNGRQNSTWYAYKPPGSGTWATESSGVRGEENALAVGGSGGVSLVYLDYANGNLLDVERSGGGIWGAPTSVDSPTARVGFAPAVAVDTTGGMHVSYYDEDNTLLKYAYRPAGGSWNVTIVDNQGDVGSSSSIAVDSAGGAHVSYRDSTNSALKYAYRPAGGSFGAPVTVDDAGNVGHGSSVAVDSAGRVHISYYDSTNGDLKYAQRPVAGSWSTTTVDSVGDVGGITSLAVNGDGAHITYVDFTNTANTLKYARVCP